MTFVVMAGWFALGLFAPPAALAIWFASNARAERRAADARRSEARLEALNARLAEDREVQWLDELWDLPTREHA